MKSREAIMDKMGALIEMIDDYTHWVDVRGSHSTVVDKAFSEGLQHFINDMDKFYRIWEERVWEEA